MPKTEKRCGYGLDLDLDDYIDKYDYHDAQTGFTFYCDKEKDHEGMHSALIDNQTIYWEEKIFK